MKTLPITQDDADFKIIDGYYYATYVIEGDNWMLENDTGDILLGYFDTFDEAFKAACQADQ